VMTATFAILLIAALLMAGVFADSVWGTAIAALTTSENEWPIAHLPHCAATVRLHSHDLSLAQP
jgi:hypothetical protein